MHAKLPGNSVQFIEVEALAAPRVSQRFEGDVEADLVPEAEAVSHRAGDAVDADGLPLDTVLLDPPFNVSDWGGERLREDKRWKYGVPWISNGSAMVGMFAAGGIWE